MNEPTAASTNTQLAATKRVEELVAAWCDRDHARAFLQVDHEAIDSTAAVRALIVEQLVGRVEPSRDLFNACGVLGRLLASRGASPSLATLTIDGARAALGAAEAPWIEPARAALAEGYAAAQKDMARAEATRRWEYPTCVVPLHDGIVAVAAGYPDDDEDALEAWAARVANAAVLGGARRVVLGGTLPARAALGEALKVAGVELLRAYEPPPTRKR